MPRMPMVMYHMPLMPMVMSNALLLLVLVLMIVLVRIQSHTWQQPICTVLVFRQEFTLEDAIGSHSCSLEANMCVTNGFPRESTALTVTIINHVETLKDNVITDLKIPA
jgi:hypothetical protein